MGHSYCNFSEERADNTYVVAMISVWRLTLSHKHVDEYIFKAP